MAPCKTNNILGKKNNSKNKKSKKNNKEIKKLKRGAKAQSTTKRAAKGKPSAKRARAAKRSAMVTAPTALRERDDYQTGDEVMQDMLTLADVEEQLSLLGREKGYLTYQEVKSALDEEGLGEAISDVLSSLADSGIDIVADEEAPLWQQDEEGSDEESDDDATKAWADDALDENPSIYSREMQRVPLLTAAQEVDLAQRIERGNMAAQELATAKGEEHIAELKALVEDGKQAYDHLVLANIRLVFSIARRYLGHGLTIEDLVQEGNTGLMRAASKFDWRRGHKFSTYATWWVRQAITRAIADHSRLIRIPVHMNDQINSIYKAKHYLFQQLRREPTPEEIAAVVGAKPSKIKLALESSQSVVSLESPIDDEGETEMGELLADESTPLPSEIALMHEQHQRIRQMLSKLPRQEYLVITLRYGLNGDRSLTLEEVGKRLGLTRERVRQIEAQALARIRYFNHHLRLLTTP